MKVKPIPESTRQRLTVLTEALRYAEQAYVDAYAALEKCQANCLEELGGSQIVADNRYVVIEG